MVRVTAAGYIRAVSVYEVKFKLIRLMYSYMTAIPRYI